MELVHPDFKLSFLHYRQNKEWSGAVDSEKGPNIKLAFSFDELSLLDDCPFVTKISEDLRREYRYFGVSYSLEAEREKLKSWGLRFPQDLQRRIPRED